MQYRLAGEDASFTIDFKVDGEFVVPSASSLFLTVRDNSGIPYPGLYKTALADVSTTSMQINVDSVVQSISTSYSLRYITVHYAYGGKKYTVDIPYTVYAFVPVTVTTDDIRALFGAEYRELPDSDIDVLFSYFTLVKEYGTTFEDAFADAVACHSANEALRYAVGLRQLPQMRSRLLSRERNDTSEFERQKIDFDKLKEEFETRFELEIGKTFDLMNSTEMASIAAGALYSSFIVSTPTDPVTNT